MTIEENGAASAAPDDTAAPATPVDGGQEATPKPDPAIEAEAREMGWVPKDKFRGPEDQWRPAEEYLKRGKELLPIVNAENRKLRKQLDDLKAEMTETVANLGRMNKVALDRQRQQIEAQYEAYKERFVELGDTKNYRAADAQKRAALKDFDQAAEEAANTKEKEKSKDTPPGDSKLSSRDQAAVDEWLEENPWFNSSRVLRAAADDAFDDVRREMPAAKMADVLAEVRNRVVADYPHKFGKPANGSPAPKVEGGGSRSAGGGNAAGRAWDKLPAEVRPIADSLIKDDGLFLEKGEKAGTHLAAARERYAKQYLQENA